MSSGTLGQTESQLPELQIAYLSEVCSLKGFLETVWGL